MDAPFGGPSLKLMKAAKASFAKDWLRLRTVPTYLGAIECSNDGSNLRKYSPKKADEFPFNNHTFQMGGSTTTWQT